MTIERFLAPHSLDAPLMTFDLVTMIAEMKAEPTWEAASRESRVVQKGQGPITIQVPEGRLSVTVGVREVPLGPESDDVSLPFLPR